MDEGIAFRLMDEIVHNDPEKVVPGERMDQDLPGYAWDLLPFKNRPLDEESNPIEEEGSVSNNKEESIKPNE